MRITQLGDDLFKVKLPLFYWSMNPTSRLGGALLDIQTRGKIVTSVTSTQVIPQVYLVSTMGVGRPNKW